MAISPDETKWLKYQECRKSVFDSVTESKKTQKKTDSDKIYENDVTRDSDFFWLSKYLVTRDFLVKSQSHDKKSQSHDIFIYSWGWVSFLYTKA